MTRQQQRILANLGRDVDRLLWWGRIILAGAVVTVAVIGTICGKLAGLVAG